MTDAAETITSSLLFIAWLLSETKHIKLGSGTINLPNHHPAQVAGEVAMIDHMAEGRFILGISPGGLLSDAEVFGNLDKDRTAMFVEAIDHILNIWAATRLTTSTVTIGTISTERTLIPDSGPGVIRKPYQKPHPPIVVTAVAPFSKGVTEAAARGWEPIARISFSQWVKTHWPKYVEGCEKGGRSRDTAKWRVAKSVFVADDLATARRYATEPGRSLLWILSLAGDETEQERSRQPLQARPERPAIPVTIASVVDTRHLGTPREGHR